MRVGFDGFYEPKGPKGAKREQYNFRFEGGRLFALGGIYAHYRAEDDDFYGFAIVTTNPGAQVAGIHDRSPVTLDTPAERETWLEGSRAVRAGDRPAGSRQLTGERSVWRSVASATVGDARQPKLP